jgi:glutamate N-acetyltransferase/amino-acid N-acetyltransferase
MHDTPQALPQGFLASGMAAGLKPSGRPDLGLLRCPGGGPWGLATTRNQAAAACVLRARALYQQGPLLQAVAVNSGQANAATGSAGRADDQRWAEALSNFLGIPSEALLTVSTGVIGVRLPLDRLLAARPALAAGLSESPAAFASAILTTDTRPKLARAELPGGGSVLGIAKGSGMIHPDLGTLLAFVLTDLELPSAWIRTQWQELIDGSLNCVSVDGDTSTNDLALLWSSGQRSCSLGQAELALREVLRNLARQVAADGEGASKLLTVRITGAPDLAGARRAARTVASSLLWKSAVHGNDPNWGRVLAALGRSGTPIDSERLSIALQGVTLYQDGPRPTDLAALSRAMDAPEVILEVDLAGGAASAEAWGCDLSEEYVQINADYTT